jgi:hypothetical protein
MDILWTNCCSCGEPVKVEPEDILVDLPQDYLCYECECIYNDYMKDEGHELTD